MKFFGYIRVRSRRPGYGQLQTCNLLNPCSTLLVFSGKSARNTNVLSFPSSLLNCPPSLPARCEPLELLHTSFDIHKPAACIPSTEILDFPSSITRRIAYSGSSPVVNPALYSVIWKFLYTPLHYIRMPIYNSS
jgi:hypothetical protein